MTQTTTRVAASTIALVLAFATFTLYTFEASADYDRGRGGDDGDKTTIDVENRASVNNTVHIDAKTGGNDANGGAGGDGDDGGDTSEGAGGRGGNGGAGGAGGTITTGVTTAIGTISNDINRTGVYVEGCGCDDDGFFPFPTRMNFIGMMGGDESTSLRIDVDNNARVTNHLDVDAKTGYNDANGGAGGDGDDGGDAGDRHGRHMSKSWNNWFSWWNTNTGGAGGNGGRGGDAGTIRTGEAYADGLVSNLVNRTVVRSTNGDDVVDVD